MAITNIQILNFTMEFFKEKDDIFIMMDSVFIYINFRNSQPQVSLKMATDGVSLIRETSVVAPTDLKK